MPEIVTPSLATSPDGPAQLATLATRVVDVLSTAERDALSGGANLFAGRTIYRNSDDISEGIETYTGAAWLKSWNEPWGYIGSATQTTAQTLIGTTAVDLTSLSVTFTALANRRYKWSAFARYGTSSATLTAYLLLTTSANTQLQGGGYAMQGGASEASPCLTFIETVSAGSTTRKLRGQTSTGTFSTVSGATSPALLLVEDIGPSGAPA